ncbi:MAG: ROK family protein [Acidobacteriota bacterium]|nr:ROK family protein [Acidobacteriota bacterium]
MVYTLAIDIGGTKVASGVFHDGKLIERTSSATDRSGGPAWMLNRIESMTSPWIKEFDIRACGVGFGGPVDFRSQRVICSTHVEGWTDFDLVGQLKRRLGIDSVIDRDTMVGALGEGYYGAGVGARPLFYMTISTGIGGGLLTENGLYHGKDSFSCEIGHHTVEPDGPECFCGSHGCLERLCAGIWLERDYGKPARELLGDPVFTRQYVRPLAQGLKSCIMLFNPARIVIGGGISKAGDALFGPLREELGRQITPWSRATVDVVPASLGDDSILWGALALAETYLHKQNMG